MDYADSRRIARLLPGRAAVLKWAAALASAVLAAPLAAALDPPPVRASVAQPADEPPPFVPPWMVPESEAFSLSDAVVHDLTGDLDAYRAGIEGDFAAAAVELETGAAYGYRSDQAFTTGSVVKLDILAVLLLRAQDEERDLTGSERALAEKMIRHSDNEAADDLFHRIGFVPGFDEGRDRLALVDTEPHPGGRWGATSTTARERITLLRAVYAGDGPLDPDSRATVRELLSGVAPEQAWGVSAAAADDDGDGEAEVKNGWVPLESEGGLWAVNSTGRIVAEDGRVYLVAVLSAGHPGYGQGVACTEHVAVSVVDAMSADISRQAPRGPVGVG